MKAMNQAQQAADFFIQNETAFHLGDLITEQSHTKTKELSSIIQESTEEGLRCLLQVDQDIIPVAEKLIHSAEFGGLIKAIVETIERGGRVVFSSCGASGRLAIILEAMWREYWSGNPIENQVLSMMTGGDRALFRSVENFEDYQSFGRRQVAEAQLNSADLMIALTEGGEISSVIGTMKEAVERGVSVYMLFNNPKDLLIQKFERSRDVLCHPDIIPIELTTGPMGLTGSTRMQATTIGLLMVGIAMEEAFSRIDGEEINIRKQFIDAFSALLNQLSTIETLKGLTELTDLEAKTYGQGGRVTYLADQFLLDVFSDTTERTPTFMIPPFRSKNDHLSPAPWTFAKDPTRNSNEAWENMLKRLPRGLDWNTDDYATMGANNSMIHNPPELSYKDIMNYQIGNEKDSSRARNDQDVFIPIHVSNATDFSNLDTNPASTIQLFIGKHDINVEKAISIPVDCHKSKTKLFEHLALKLIFNTTSTATMAKLGRVQGNWMIQVDATNKKLIDRATRIVQHFSGLSYEEACLELHKTIYKPEINRTSFKTSYVIQTLN